jgi:RND family efflux transporter MFP subunit
MYSLSHKARVTLLVIIIGITLILALVLLKPKSQREPRTPKPLLNVSVIVAAPAPLKISINSQGTVAPRREIDLVSQVSGKIVAVADNYANGGFFQANSKLVQIEPADYEFAVIRAKAQLARAQESVALEEGRSRQARREWRDLGDQTANALFLRQPQLNAAQATLDSAQADLQKAQLDLNRTGISAPFQGRIRNTFVDLGQYVTPGTRIAKVYSTDVVEVRLPMSDREALLVDLPVSFEDSDAISYPEVTLRSRVGEVSDQWRGRIVRTDASIDVRSRMTFAVAEIENPFKSDLSESQRPLSIGLFVEAQISGRVIEDGLRLPKDAIYRGREILVLNDNNQINFQTVSIVRSYADTVVTAGIAPGTIIVTTRIPLPINGMQVLPVREPDKQSLAPSAASFTVGKNR